MPYDPSLKYLFFGEEMGMLARLYTAGYDVYAPSRAVVFHHWERSYRPSFFHDVPDPFHLRARSVARIRALLRCPPSEGHAPEIKPRTKIQGYRDGALHFNTSALVRELRERGDGVAADQREAQLPPGEFGRFGLGSVRTFEEWQEHCDVDFAKGVIGDRARGGGLSKEALVGVGGGSC